MNEYAGNLLVFRANFIHGAIFALLKFSGGVSDPKFKISTAHSGPEI
jgi:hypothetical protein